MGGIILDSLRSKLAPDVYSQWIEPLKLVEISNLQLIVSCPSGIDAEQLSKAYRGLIELAFFEANGRQIQLKFHRQTVRQANSRPPIPF